MSESLIQHRAEVQGLATAILLPSVSVFGESSDRTPGSAGPLTQVVGIGLFQRAVLTLQRAGIRQLIVLAGPEEDQLKQALGRGPRVTIPVRWMPIREFPLDDPRTWEAMAAEVPGFCLVASVRGVFSRALIESLRREVQEGQAILVAQPVVQRAAGDRRVSVKVQAELCPIQNRIPFVHTLILLNSITHTHGFDAHGQRLALIWSHKLA